jgi:hypothetical protein
MSIFILLYVVWCSGTVVIIKAQRTGELTGQDLLFSVLIGWFVPFMLIVEYIAGYLLKLKDITLWERSK